MVLGRFRFRGLVFRIVLGVMRVEEDLGFRVSGLGLRVEVEGCLGLIEGCSVGRVVQGLGSKGSGLTTIRVRV